MKIIDGRIKEIKKSEKDINLYMKIDKDMSEKDIAEVHMIISMMDEAITLLNMKKRI